MSGATYCITFCVTPARLRSRPALLHHFLCHTGTFALTPDAAASLFVSHQHVCAHAGRCCITFCVTPARLRSRRRCCITFRVTPARLLPRRTLLHHFLCHTGTFALMPGAAASLFVSHRHVCAHARRCCITFCVTPARLRSRPALLHHFLCHTGTFAPTPGAGASLFVSHRHVCSHAGRCCITFCVAPARRVPPLFLRLHPAYLFFITAMNIAPRTAAYRNGSATLPIMPPME